CVAGGLPWRGAGVIGHNRNVPPIACCTDGARGAIARTPHACHVASGEPRNDHGAPPSRSRAVQGGARATTGGAPAGCHVYDLGHVTRRRATGSAAAPQAAESGPRRGSAVFVAQPAATVLW